MTAFAAARPDGGAAGRLLYSRSWCRSITERPKGRRRRFRPIPVRMLVPNVITLLAICAG
jgi:hypothetical protein